MPLSPMLTRDLLAFQKVGSGLPIVALGEATSLA